MPMLQTLASHCDLSFATIFGKVAPKLLLLPVCPYLTAKRVTVSLAMHAALHFAVPLLLLLQGPRPCLPYESQVLPPPCHPLLPCTALAGVKFRQRQRQVLAF
jgi:hypothetical protein